MNRITQQTVRLAHLVGRLPHIRLVGILQLADCRQGLVVDDKGRTLAVRTLELVDQLNKVICRDRCTAGGHASLRRGQKASGLVVAVTVEEGILLSIGDSLAKLLDDVALQIEGIIIEQFLRDLDRHMELVSIHNNLVESSFSKRKCAAFLNPGCGRLGSGDVDFPLTAGGNMTAEITHNALLVQHINETAVIFLRH